MQIVWSKITGTKFMVFTRKYAKAIKPELRV